MKWMTRGVAYVGLACMIRLACGAAAFAAEPVPRAASSRKPQIPMLKVEQYSLPNGLTVLLHEDHKTPVVAVNVWYKSARRTRSRVVPASRTSLST